MRGNRAISFDDLLKELQDQKSGASASSQVTLEQLFNGQFMSKHSNEDSFQAFLEKGNFQAWTRDDLKFIEGELLDRHVARETKFPDWKTMLDAANKELEQ